MSNKPPILDDWEGYVFAEASITQPNQRLTISDPVTKAMPGSYAPMRFDKTQDGVTGTMMGTAQQVDAQFKKGGSIDRVPLSGTDREQVFWFVFSPYELFLEKVLSERLKTLEIGELG